MKKFIIVILALPLLVWSCAEKKEISLKTLLEELVDNESRTYFPDDDPYTVRQFSSYDRATVAPGDKSWFANWDRSMFIRTDSLADGRKEYVMMDAEGPGAIVRFWMTFAGEDCGKGTLRIYIDGNSKPVVEAAAFDVLSGTILTDGVLATSVSDSSEYHMRGHNLYFPIPYSKSCKVTYESQNIKDAGAKTGGEAVYYNINYRTYQSDTKVVSFAMEQMTQDKDLIVKVQQQLEQRDVEIVADEIKISKLSDQVISPENNVKLELSGSHAIKHLRIRLDTAGMNTALRTTIIEISFDSERTVWAPLGDFFGTGYLLRSSNLWYTRVSDNGVLDSYWVMPYKKNCEIKLTNISTRETVKIAEIMVQSTPYRWKSNSMHFGAGWQQFTNLATGEMKNNEGDGEPFDINYVELTGKGRYMGDALVMFNTVYAWWGEGDEKIYVDGETFPSHIGTGTEDYYGYAWCRPEKFANHPFIAQPDGSGNFVPGYSINIRHRGLDDIPFTKSLKVDMEMWHWTRAVINFAPISYWYMMPKGTTNRTTDVENALAPLARVRTDLVPNRVVNGKIEGESLDLVNKTGGNYRFQNTLKYGWSDNMQMFWSGAAVGETLTVSFISAQSSTQDVELCLTKGPDYGVFDISINDRSVTNVDLKNSEVVLTKVTIPDVKIKEGLNYVKIKVRRQTSEKKSAFGVDYLTFK